MDISSQRFNRVLVLDLGGRIDHLNADEYRQSILPHLANPDQAMSHVVLNLADLQFTSSAGLHVLMIAMQEAKTHGCHMVVASLQPLISEIFQISRFDLVFHIYPNVREAIQDLDPVALEAYNAA